jgi:hypothetical protein
MGNDYSNVYPGPHYAPGGVLIGLKPRVHRGNIQLDTEAPHEAVGSGLAAIRGAAETSLVAFVAACNVEWSGWLPTPAPGWVEDLRDAVNQLAG